MGSWRNIHCVKYFIHRLNLCFIWFYFPYFTTPYLEITEIGENSTLWKMYFSKGNVTCWRHRFRFRLKVPFLQKHVNFKPENPGIGPLPSVLWSYWINLGTRLCPHILSRCSYQSYFIIIFFYFYQWCWEKLTCIEIFHQRWWISHLDFAKWKHLGWSWLGTLLVFTSSSMILENTWKKHLIASLLFSLQIKQKGNSSFCKRWLQKSY